MKNTASAAAYLALAESTLNTWRAAGRGPRWVKLGAKVFYPVAELDAYVRANLRGPRADARTTREAE